MYEKVPTPHTDLGDCLSSLYKAPSRGLLDKVAPSSFAKMIFLSPGQLFFAIIYSFAVVSATISANTSNEASGQDIGEIIIS